MEEKTLQELNEEYAKVKEEVKSLNSDLEEAKKNKEKVASELVAAETAYEDAKQAHELKKIALEASKNANLDMDIASIEEQVIQAKTAMEDSELLLKSTQEELKKAEENLIKIEENAKNSNNRMNLILVSFASNETIYNTLVNEVEVDFEDKVEENDKKQQDIENNKTKISNDKNIQKHVTDLKELLQRYEKTLSELYKEKGNAKLHKELDQIGSDIKNKRSTIRRLLTTMSEVELIGSKIPDKEIDMMAMMQDDQGRMVIPELDKRKSGLKEKKGSLLDDRDQTLKNMSIIHEIAKNFDKGTLEYQKLLEEIQKIEGEINSANEIKQEAEDNLAKIPEQRAQLESELANLEKNINTEEISRLEAEKKRIEEKPVSKITNPRLAKIDEEIKDLEDKKATGGKGDVETEEYKNAKKEYEKAEKALEDEKNNPSISEDTRNVGDIIGTNPRISEIQREKSEITTKRENLYNAIVDKDENLKKLKAGLKDKQDENEKAKSDNDDEKSKVGDLKRESYETGYVDNLLYKQLIPKEDNKEPAYLAFQKYKELELNLRKAMQEIQKNPSNIENKALFVKAIEDYNEAMNNFKDELEIISGVRPSSENVHNYLLGVLNEESKTKEMDEGYNLSNVANRIAILKAQGVKRADKETLEKLESLDKHYRTRLTKILEGKEVSGKELAQLINTTNDVINKFEDPTRVKDILTGTGMPEPSKKQPFWRRWFGNKMPVKEETYDFHPNNPPEKVKEYKESRKKLIDSIRQQTALESEISRKSKEYDDAVKNAMTPEEQAEIQALEDEYKKLETEETSIGSKQINITRLKELRKAVIEAKSRLDSTKQYEATVDVDKINERIKTLEREKAFTPKEIDNPSEVEDKKTEARKIQGDIDRLSNGNSEKISEIKTRIQDLLRIESIEKQKIEDAKKTIKEKTPILEDKKQRSSVIEKVIGKMKLIKNNLIHIKDSKRLSRKGSEAIAPDLSSDMKNKKLDDEEVDR